MTIKPKRILLTILSSLLVLTACGTNEVIRVVVTPTQDPESAAAVTEMPTATPSQTPTATDTATPPPSALPTTVTESVATSPPTGPTVIGPVVGPDYVRPTLPVTPTMTPSESETPEITLTPSITPTPVPGLNPNQMGLQLDANLSFEDFQRAVGDADATGVRWIKIQVNWEFLQPNGPDQLDKLQLFERQVELASRPEDMRVLLSFAKAPAWTRSNLAESGPPDDPQALADFITLVLRDTKIGQASDAIEIWNEPNLQREWQGTLPFSGAGYMQLFAPAYQAVRAVAPQMTVVTAGLAPTSNLPGAIDDRAFLEQMYDNGLRDYIGDHRLVIGAHPYGWANDPEARCCGDPNSEPGWDDNAHFFFLENLEATRAIMEQNGHASAQLWPTEFGWATWQGIPSQAPEAWLTYLTPIQQADYVIRAFEHGQRTDYIGPMFLWNLNFANQTTVERGDEIVAFSIIQPTFDVRERPAFWVLAKATGAVPN